MNHSRQVSTTTASALGKIVKKLDKQNLEITERLVEMTANMQAHIEADAVAFQALGVQIIEVNKDVKDLLASRSFLRGAWFALAVCATFVVAAVGAFLTWYK